MSDAKLPPLPRMDVGVSGQVKFAYSERVLIAYAKKAVRQALAAQKPLVLYDPVSGAVTPVGRPVSEWMPIETALVAERDFLEDVVRCLVYGPQIGVQVGRAWRYPDGTVRAQAFGFHGDWEITHWMPLPAPPKENNHAEGADQ